MVWFLLGYWHDIGWKCISVSTTFALNPVGIVLWKLKVGKSETESCVSCVFHDVSQMSTLIYFHVAFPLARHWLKLWRRTFPWQASICSTIPSALREWRPFVSRIPSGCSFCVVWCGMLSTGILAWYWRRMHLCKRHLLWILDPVGFVLWKLRVGNWEFCLLCISWGLTDVSFELLPRRFPFGQALAEALKKNTSVTSIGLSANSIGAEGMKAFCVPGFQVAAQDVFVARLLKGFVVCSCSSFAFPGFESYWLSVKWVNFFLTWIHSVWYDVVCMVCFLLGYWHDIGWKCISVSKT